MKHSETCKHRNSIFNCQECDREVFDSFLNRGLELGKEYDKLVSEGELDINSPEFLRQT